MSAADAADLARSGLAEGFPWRLRDAVCAYDRGKQRRVLAAQGLPLPPWDIVNGATQAYAAARRIGPPLSVLAAIPRVAGMERRVDDLADLPLAVSVVGKYAADERLVLEKFVDGRCISFLGIVLSGRFELLMALQHYPAPPPLRFPIALAGPTSVPTAAEKLAADAVTALAIECAALRITLRDHEGAWEIDEIDFCPGLDWMPSDLPAAAGGTGYWESHARVAFGDTPELKRPQRGVALAWLASRSGEVARVPAQTDLPPYCRLVCGVSPGDAVGHVLDVVSRNRLGYLVATMDDATQALQAALECRSTFAIETRAVMEANS